MILGGGPQLICLLRVICWFLVLHHQLQTGVNAMHQKQPTQDQLNSLWQSRDTTSHGVVDDPRNPDWAVLAITITQNTSTAQSMRLDAQALVVPYDDFRSQSDERNGSACYIRTRVDTGADWEPWKVNSR